MGRVRHPCPVVLVVWLVFVGGLGGIATIGAALRRVVGVSGVYGRKTPRVVAWKGQRRGPFRWRCGRLARAATCGVNGLFAFKGVGGVGIPRSGGGSVGGSFGG